MATLLSQDPDPQHHVTSVPTYLMVFLGLMVGTALTVAARYVDLGPLNAPIALTIAVAKTVLVVLFFMHLRHSTRLTWVIVIGAFLWVGVLFVLTFSDYLTRAWMVYGDIG
jgi:cytochrome c oxidase subunit IV